MEVLEPILIEAKDPKSRWVATDFNDNIIVEGKIPVEVVAKVKKKKIEDYLLVFIPEKDKTYIF